MSEEVEILKNGEWKRKYVVDLSEDELRCLKRCPGENDFGPCHAPMGIAMRAGKPSYAYQLYKSEKTHVPGCNCYKPAKKSRMSHPDNRCADISFDELQKRISKRQLGRDVPPVDVTNGDLDDPNDEGSYPRDRIIRDIERVRTLPSTAGALAVILESLSVDSLFCASHVHDYIVDHRTINFYRKHGIPADRPIMILAQKIRRDNHNIADPTRELVFADCTYNFSRKAEIGNCLQFRVRDFETRKYLKDIFEKKDIGKHYLVLLCYWKKDPVNPNTYIAVGETPGCIGYIKTDKCQTPFCQR